jgi:hypothetical protein
MNSFCCALSLNQRKVIFMQQRQDSKIGRKSVLAQFDLQDTVELLMIVVATLAFVFFK